MSIDRRNFLKTLGVVGGTLTVGKSFGATQEEKSDIEFNAILYDSTLCGGCQVCEFVCGEQYGLPWPEDEPVAAAKTPPPNPERDAFAAAHAAETFTGEKPPTITEEPGLDEPEYEITAASYTAKVAPSGMLSSIHVGGSEVLGGQIEFPVDGKTSVEEATILTAPSPPVSQTAASMPKPLHACANTPCSSANGFIAATRSASHCRSASPGGMYKCAIASTSDGSVTACRTARGML